MSRLANGFKLENEWISMTGEWDYVEVDGVDGREGGQEGGDGVGLSGGNHWMEDEEGHMAASGGKSGGETA